MSIFTQTLPRRSSAPFSSEAAQAGSRDPLSADVSGWSWRNPLNLLPLGFIVLIALSFILMITQTARSAPPRDVAAVTATVTGRYATATTDLPIYHGDAGGDFVHSGVLFGGVTVQVSGVSADGQWWQVPCGDGSDDACWVSAAPGLLIVR